MAPSHPTDLPETPVPVIESTEPVYPSVDADNSVFMTCTLYFDSERYVFWNFDADDEWVLDDHAFADATYEVEGEVFTDLASAKVAALKGTPAWPASIPDTLPPEYAHQHIDSIPQTLFA